MKCPKCGFENLTSDKRCQACGQALMAGASSGPAKKCRHCGSEYQSGHCPACGRWAGPVPGGIIAIAVLSFFGSTVAILGSLAVIMVLTSYSIPESRMGMAFVFIGAAVFSMLVSALQVFFAINLLRLKQWAYTAFRVMLIISICLSGLSLLLLILGGRLGVLELIQTVVGMVINIAILTYLRGKDYIFSTQAGRASAPTKRKCPACGNTELTSFDNVCPKCKKPLS